MIKFYYNLAPNPTKVALCLEEMGLPYELVPVDTRKAEQHASTFLAINPNAKVPAIIDNGATVFDSNAILLYLAEKTGQFLPKDPVAKYKSLEWLMWQMGGVGPMFGQAHHFLRAAPTKIEYGIKRYVDEAKRLYGVLDKQLAGNAFAAGADYSIADMAIFPWTARHEWHQVNLADFPNVKRWYDTVNARPAVTKGMAVPYLN